MKFKLILAFLDETLTADVLDAARHAGATGATVLTKARGEGLVAERTFLGMRLETPRDVVLLLVEASRAYQILETVSDVGQFDKNPGSGIACQIDIEDVVGLASQVAALENEET